MINLISNFTTLNTCGISFKLYFTRNCVSVTVEA